MDTISTLKYAIQITVRLINALFSFSPTTVQVITSATWDKLSKIAESAYGNKWIIGESWLGKLAWQDHFGSFLLLKFDTQLFSQVFRYAIQIRFLFCSYSHSFHSSYILIYCIYVTNCRHSRMIKELDHVYQQFDWQRNRFQCQWKFTYTS